MSCGKAIRILGAIGLVMALAGGTFAVRWTWAQESPPVAREGAAKKESREPEKDYHQRSLEIYEFKKAAKSGPERGQEIFYYKCWYCHNEYSKGGAPQLKSLYKHPQLLSGQPVSDDTVKEKIRNGGAGMPAFRYTLNDADVSDLVSFLRDKCCFDPDNPPANPRYRAH